MKYARFLAAGIAMALAAGITLALTPTRKMADVGERVQLERLIPAEFAGWRIDTSLAPVTVDPALQARLSKIYNQTVSRTYINGRGDRVMLSIAYGGDQRSDMQVHRPEVCYPAQGFQVLANRPALLETPFGSIPVRRLETRAAQRYEPVTYWMTIGDQAVPGLLERKLTALSYGFRGVIPDGLLFRISSIDRHSANGFAVQESFVTELLATVEPSARRRLAGVER